MIFVYTSAWQGFIWGEGGGVAPPLRNFLNELLVWLHCDAGGFSGKYWLKERLNSQHLQALQFLHFWPTTFLLCAGGCHGSQSWFNSLVFLSFTVTLRQEVILPKYCMRFFLATIL